MKALFGLATLCVFLPPAFAGAQDDSVDFGRDIAPIFERHCIRCHQPANRKGDLSLSTIQDLIADGHVVPGKPAESDLLKVVRPAKSGKRPKMPKEGDPLSERETALLKEWISRGAPWPEGVILKERSKADKSWWALQPLARREPPAPEGLPEAWARNPIDRFVFAKLREKGLFPNAPADRRKLTRRLSYDLLGLPPTPEEVEAFLADKSPEAYEKQVDRLLASPRYGERWGRHWLDVVRFGESVGFERNTIIDNAWPFRDYVIRSFNEDKPFRDLVLEHLAGDAIGPGKPDVEIGTGFLVCGPFDNVGNKDPRQAAVIRGNVLDDIARATGETFLGYTVGCARCHDHKFDPITAGDYYALYATFAGVTHGDRVVASPEAKKEHTARLASLHQARDRLAKERAALEEELFARGDSRNEEHEARWTRPRADRVGTEDSFEPVVAKFVRLVVEALDTATDQRSGFTIDEFEIWTAEEKPRNVALAAQGARAEGAKPRRGRFHRSLQRRARH